MPCESDVRKFFLFNNRFKCVRGKRFFKDNWLDFGDTYKNTNGHYRSAYGYLFAHTGVILDMSDYNLSQGLTRLTCCIFPEPHRGYPLETNEYDTMLRENQRNWIRENETALQRVMEQRGPIIYEHDHDTMREKLTEEPHEKQAGRKEDYKRGVEEGDAYRDAHIDAAEVKGKAGETSKWRKYQRVIVNPGIAASLQTVPTAKVIKKWKDDKPVYNNGVKFIFLASPNPTRVAVELLEIWNGTTGHILAFSDDAIVAIKIAGKRRIFNVDFSTNDASYTDSFFEWFFRAHKIDERTRRAIRGQIKANMVLFSRDKRRQIHLQPLESYLQSGIGITSEVNTSGHEHAFFEISNSHFETVDDLESAFERTGHKVTLEECYEISDLQFLKMSLAMDTKGVYRAVLNAGVIFRASGVCRFDLPGRGDIAKRAEDFQQTLINGLTSTGRSPALRALAPRPMTNASKNHKAATTNALYSIELEKEVPEFTDEQMFARYALTPHELLEVQTMCAESGLGTTAYSKSIGKILTKDYGLGAPVRE